MDWLLARQGTIEASLARRHLSEGSMVLYDLSSSWMEGTHCPLAARGYSRDHKSAKTQIEYDLLTDQEGRPVSVEVFPGNTADPTAFISAVEAVRTRFCLKDVVMVGDRGMITSARIEALKEVGGLGWTPRFAPLLSPPWPSLAHCSCCCSKSRTWPRSPVRTTQESASLPVAIRRWPKSGPASAKLL